MKPVIVLLSVRYLQREPTVLSSIPSHTSLLVKISEDSILLLSITDPALIRMILLIASVHYLMTMLSILNVQLLLTITYLLMNVGVIMKSCIFTRLRPCLIHILMLLTTFLLTFLAKTFGILLLCILFDSKLNEMNTRMHMMMMMMMCLFQVMIA